MSAAADSPSRAARAAAGGPATRAVACPSTRRTAADAGAGRAALVLLARLVDEVTAPVPDSTAGRALTARYVDRLVGRLAFYPGTVDTAGTVAVRAAVERCLAGDDPVAWRDRAGPVPAAETVAFTVAAAETMSLLARVEPQGLDGLVRRLSADLADATVR